MGDQLLYVLLFQGNLFFEVDILFVILLLIPQVLMVRLWAILAAQFKL